MVPGVLVALAVVEMAQMEDAAGDIVIYRFFYFPVAPNGTNASKGAIMAGWGGGGGGAYGNGTPGNGGRGQYK